MAKKKFESKNIEINKEELSVTKIGEISTVEQNPWFLFIIFGVLLVAVFFFPTIVDKLNGKEEEPGYSLTPSTNPSETEENPEENPVETVYYDFGEDLAVRLQENITLHHFKLNENILSFTVSNNSTNRFNFNNFNYFLELYNEQDMLLERVMLSKDSISKESSVDFAYEISPATGMAMKKIAFVNKEISDYPNITLNKNEAGEEMLICSKQNQTITYKFQSEKLNTITDVVNYTKEESLVYNTAYDIWKNKAVVYDSVDGVSSTFIDAGSGFVVNTVIDTKNAKVASLENADYYAYETVAKVIKFEMETRGFSCK